VVVCAYAPGAMVWRIRGALLMRRGGLWCGVGVVRKLELKFNARLLPNWQKEHAHLVACVCGCDAIYNQLMDDVGGGGGGGRGGGGGGGGGGRGGRGAGGRGRGGGDAARGGGRGRNARGRGRGR
jgi:hypothetical protein